MNCPLETNAIELLLDYSAGRLNEAVRISLNRHMDSCAACAAFRVEQTAVWNALDVWEAPPVSMDFNRNLWRRIDQASSRPWYRTIADSINWKPLVPLTATVALIVAGFVFDHRSETNPNAGFTVTEANQVEQALDDIQLLHQFDVTGDAGARTM